MKTLNMWQNLYTNNKTINKYFFIAFQTLNKCERHSTLIIYYSVFEITNERSTADRNN